ncbi:hypothetical protein [Nocardioides sp.]|uniref:hypothetical protein n=1 Tax=Nocardioides sp. TaxID=35761 RepID=UPI003D1097ED
MTSKALLNSLTEQETVLLLETEKDALAGLDEDQLVELHDRIRRARTKYVKQYRRGASASVASSGGRGKAAPRNRRAADKAEVFEEALARVSTSLAAAARRSAAALKTERLEAARAGGGGPAGAPDDADSTPTPRTKRAPRTPVEKKNVASSRAQGARRQAKRDAR